MSTRYERFLKVLPPEQVALLDQHPEVKQAVERAMRFLSDRELTQEEQNHALTIAPRGPSSRTQAPS